MVILVTVAVMGAVGALTYLAVRRWPQAHLADPQVHPTPDPALTGSDAGTGRPDQSAAPEPAPVAELVGWKRIRAERTDPSKATGLALTVAAAVVVLGVVGVGVVLAMVREHAGFAAFDRAFAKWGYQNATSASTWFLEKITFFGSTIGVVIVVTVAGLLAYRTSPSKALAGFLLVTVAGQLLITNTVKAIVDRARPDIGPLSSFSGPSFPSGHSAAAAAGLAAAALVLGRRRSLKTKALLASVAAGLAAGVAASRVLLGVHWFTDVVAGLLLGWGWFALCSIAFGGRLLRFGAPVKEAKAAARAEAIAKTG